MTSQTVTLKQVSCLSKSTSVVNLGGHLGKQVLLTGVQLVGMEMPSAQMQVLAGSGIFWGRAYLSHCSGVGILVLWIFCG